MAIEVLEIEGPAFLASALVNGDTSGLVDGDDDRTLERFLREVPEGAYVVDVKRDDDGEAEESWFGRWVDGLGHSLVTYIAHRQIGD